MTMIVVGQPEKAGGIEKFPDTHGNHAFSSLQGLTQDRGCVLGIDGFNDHIAIFNQRFQRFFNDPLSGKLVFQASRSCIINIIKSCQLAIFF